MPAIEAARQMALADRHFLNPPRSITWDLAMQRQAAVRWGGDMGMLTDLSPGSI